MEGEAEEREGQGGQEQLSLVRHLSRGRGQLSLVQHLSRGQGLLSLVRHLSSAVQQQLALLLLAARSAHAAVSLRKLAP